MKSSSFLSSHYFVFFLLAASLAFSSCVPKTQYEDQQARLQETQTKLQSLEASSAECDKETFLQLKEQAQSLDLLTQELVDRNTELSKQVAQLKVAESSSKNEGQSCDRKITTSAKDCESKVERTRVTYEDEVTSLKAEISKLRAELDKAQSDLKAAHSKPKKANTKK